MRVKVLFDKYAVSKKLYTGWGVSFLLGDNVLFDTGENGSWLVRNMRMLKVDLSKLKAVVISHDHWDHQGGLWELLKKKRGLMVYSCPGFSVEFKDKVKQLKGKIVESAGFKRVLGDIFVTGEIAGEYKGEYMPEQAIVVKSKKGISVITGCAHPGIVKMIEKVLDKFDGRVIYSVIGGFHLMEKDRRMLELIAGRFKEHKIIKAGPTHCSGKTAEDIFKRKYSADFISIKVGKDIYV